MGREVGLNSCVCGGPWILRRERGTRIQLNDFISYMIQDGVVLGGGSQAPDRFLSLAFFVLYYFLRRRDCGLLKCHE
jgi:hypothetical protein